MILYQSGGKATAYRKDIKKNAVQFKERDGYRDQWWFKGDHKKKPHLENGGKALPSYPKMSTPLNSIRGVYLMAHPEELKKGGKWIQSATKSIKERGTEGVCTGEKFGSSSCPPGSKRYNLAKVFRSMAKKRKHKKK